MAQNALAHGDDLTTMTNQAYGVWQPDYEGQMEFGQIRTEPTLQTYISKCAWCDAWKKHNLMEYGKLYCVNVDNAVYQGFRSDFTCAHLSPAMSWGGDQCKFDWGHPISPEESKELAKKKKELGTSCMKDFNFHTAHLKYTISRFLVNYLGRRRTKSRFPRTTGIHRKIQQRISGCAGRGLPLTERGRGISGNPPSPFR